ncbi:hypothetical protein ABW20_dc0106403 [Dactylellina cionopaga]|nr:hypothetical protein ABW20_dc0106403 [Dactylellina cionopaga]
MGLIGKLIHFSVDAVIVSAFLAGVKRSTGLSIIDPEYLCHEYSTTSNCLCFESYSFKTEKIESKDFRGVVNRYLDFGEWVMDQSIAVMGTSQYFERKTGYSPPMNHRLCTLVFGDISADKVDEAIGF